MAEHFTIAENANQSKNTRLTVFYDFGRGRFNRDDMAHASRYLFVAQTIIELARRQATAFSLLDIGCGNIPLAWIFNNTFVVRKSTILDKYVGLDIDEKCLARAEADKLDSFPLELLKGDITDGALGQFTDKQFDIVVCLEVIEHIQPQFVAPLLAEIKRLANWAFISTPNLQSGPIAADHIKEWPYAELKAEIQQAGLKIKREIGVFCRIPDYKRAAQKDTNLQNIYDYLNTKMDNHFLSITLAKFAPRAAQNILWVCQGEGEL